MTQTSGSITLDTDSLVRTLVRELAEKLGGALSATLAADITPALEQVARALNELQAPAQSSLPTSPLALAEIVPISPEGAERILGAIFDRWDIRDMGLATSLAAEFTARRLTLAHLPDQLPSGR